MVAKEGLAVGKEVSCFRQPQSIGNHLPHKFLASLILASKCHYIAGEGIINRLLCPEHAIESMSHKTLACYARGNKTSECAISSLGAVRASSNKAYSTVILPTF